MSYKASRAELHVFCEVLRAQCVGRNPTKQFAAPEMCNGAGEKKPERKGSGFS
jgi:hypothetical protein